MKGGKREGVGRKRGNPNKATASIREAAQQYTETAIQTLVEVMSDETAPHSARVSAANSLLDRGYGRPRQELELKPVIIDPFPEKSELNALRNKRLAEAKERNDRMRAERAELGIDIIGFLSGIT